MATPQRTRNSTCCERLAALFRARRGEWLDGRQLARVGGVYAWRTRLTDLRRPPFNMVIVNRLRRIDRGDGTRVAVSEYRHLETVEATA